MHASTALALLAAAGALTPARGLPLPRHHYRREVPQEHSHEKSLTATRTALLLNNPDNIADPVFGLLGNAAASQGQGNIADTDCLQQATADQAFTNAKAADDIEGTTAALVYRAIERNTGKVGLKSVLCTSIKAVNPEIAALTQHQDPASDGAAATNKAITLELARQIASIGGDPQIALQSGTFAPGDLNDATGKGNSCDDLDDPEGCIFTKNLLVEDATAAEIDAAVAGAGAGNAAGAGNNNAGAAVTASAVASNTASAAVQETAAASTTAAAAETATQAATAATATKAAASNNGNGRGDGMRRGNDDGGMGRGNGNGRGNNDNNNIGRGNNNAAAAATCPPAVTVTVTAGAGAGAAAEATAAPAPPAAPPAAAAGMNAAVGTGAAAGAGAAAGNVAVAAGGVNQIADAANLAANVDLGDCPNIAIGFAAGINNRKETAYINANRQQFPQGEAQNPNIITRAACDQLINTCGLNQQSPGHQLCLQAKAAVEAIAVRDGSVADTWNSFFGITTNFASIQALDNQGNPVGGGAAAATAAGNAAAGNSANAGQGGANKTGQAQSQNQSQDQGQANSANDNANGNGNADNNAAAGAGAAAGAATGANVNAFTGSFGSAPVAVQNVGGNRPFVVNGDSFVNSGAALGRACDVQKNRCANAVNSKQVQGSVADCDAQAQQCRAANGQ